MAPALALFTIYILINYVDRGNLSIAAPLLKDELRLSASQLGILVSAFFWTHTVFIFVSGWLVDRFNVNWVIAGGFTVWSLATAATGLVHGLTMLLLMRLLLGVGESVAFPSTSKSWPCICRSAIAASPAQPLTTTKMRASFKACSLQCIAIGLASLVWLPAWKKWMPRGLAQTVAASPGGPRLVGILRRRSFWGASLGHFCANYESISR